VDYTKKRHPSFSCGKAAQFVLWEEEKKQSKVTPSAVAYNQDDEHVKMNRFKGISLGYDVKSN